MRGAALAAVLLLLAAGPSRAETATPASGTSPMSPGSGTSPLRLAQSTTPFARAPGTTPLARAPGTTLLPPAHDGVITPSAGSRIDPHMPVMHPARPGRTPVIRPPHRSAGGGTVIDPR